MARYAHSADSYSFALLGKCFVRASVALVVLLVLSPVFAAMTPTSAAEDAYALLLSNRADRGNPTPLNSATVQGDAYIFSSPTTGVQRVRFYADDPSMEREPWTVEYNAPYDLQGSAGKYARPFDTTTLPDGPHSVTAAIVRADKPVVVVTGWFVVANATDPGKDVSAPFPKPTTTTTMLVPTSTTSTTTSTTSTTSAPATTTTTTAPPGVIPKILFGIGSEASTARDTRLVDEAPMRMLTSWYNGPNDLNWMPGWSDDVVPQSYAAGYALHLVVWTGDPEGPLTTKYGPACGRAYPLSDRFLGDMQRLAETFAGSASGPPLYITLFTEFQTYPCKDNAWSATPEATNYYLALKDRYLEAVALFHQTAPNAKVSIGWGGWQARWDSPTTGGGRSLFAYFEDVMEASDFQSFQAMASDSNVSDVRAMTKTLGAYGPVMLAHYKPDNSSQPTFDADVRAMLTDAYLTEMRSHGLFAMSFMDHKNLSGSESTYQLVREAVERYSATP